MDFLPWFSNALNYRFDRALASVTGILKTVKRVGTTIQSYFMKEFLRTVLATILSVTFLLGNAQTNIDDEEAYVKQNIAYTNFKILGVNSRYHARCVSPVNYAEPTRTLKIITIGSSNFYDNGKGNDLVANDGILTSEELYSYNESDAIVPPGEYRNTKENYLVHDPEFAFAGVIDKIKIQLVCGVKWMKCSEWPIELQAFCRQMSWPFNGGPHVHCRLEVVIELYTL